jgi:hypothetical protein
MEERLSSIENDLMTLKGDLRTALSQLEEESITFTDGVNVEFTKHKLALNEVVEGAKKEFV